MFKYIPVVAAGAFAGCSDSSSSSSCEYKQGDTVLTYTVKEKVLAISKLTCAGKEIDASYATAFKADTTLFDASPADCAAVATKLNKADLCKTKVTVSVAFAPKTINKISDVKVTLPNVSTVTGFEVAAAKCVFGTDAAVAMGTDFLAAVTKDTALWKDKDNKAVSDLAGVKYALEQVGADMCVTYPSLTCKDVAVANLGSLGTTTKAVTVSWYGKIAPANLQVDTIADACNTSPAVATQKTNLQNFVTAYPPAATLTSCGASNADMKTYLDGIGTKITTNVCLATVCADAQTFVSGVSFKYYIDSNTKIQFYSVSCTGSTLTTPKTLATINGNTIIGASGVVNTPGATCKTLAQTDFAKSSSAAWAASDFCQ